MISNVYIYKMTYWNNRDPNIHLKKIQMKCGKIYFVIIYIKYDYFFFLIYVGIIQSNWTPIILK